MIKHSNQGKCLERSLPLSYGKRRKETQNVLGSRRKQLVCTCTSVLDLATRARAVRVYRGRVMGKSQAHICSERGTDVYKND